MKTHALRKAPNTRLEREAAVRGSILTVGPLGPSLVIPLPFLPLALRHRRRAQEPGGGLQHRVRPWCELGVATPGASRRMVCDGQLRDHRVRRHTNSDLADATAVLKEAEGQRVHEGALVSVTVVSGPRHMKRLAALEEDRDSGLSHTAVVRPVSGGHAQYTMPGVSGTTPLSATRLAK